MLWILLNFFPIGWPQLNAVFEHGFAYARSMAFYDTTLIWQWMRLPVTCCSRVGALLMAWDFLVKLRPLYPKLVEAITRRPAPRSGKRRASNWPKEEWNDRKFLTVRWS